MASGPSAARPRLRQRPAEPPGLRQADGIGTAGRGGRLRARDEGGGCGGRHCPPALQDERAVAAVPPLAATRVSVAGMPGPPPAGRGRRNEKKKGGCSTCKNLIIAALVLVIAAGSAVAYAQSRTVETTADVEVRVWQGVNDGALYLSTRPAEGTWTTHNTPLDMSERSPSGRFRQSNFVTVSVPVEVDPFADDHGDTFAAVSRTEKQRVLAEALFKYGASLAFGYNDYRNCPNDPHSHPDGYSHSGSWCGQGGHPAHPGYRGGHSGWDVDRTDRGGTGHAFFSLTSGTVACQPGAGRYGLIAVRTGDHIVKYLHGPHDESLFLGKAVARGDRLGTIGNLGLNRAPGEGLHVHVEVSTNTGDPCSISDGAGTSGSIDPVDFLYARQNGN